MPPPRPTHLARILLLATVAVWGTTFSIVKNALGDASPLVFNLLRMALASAVLLLLNRRHLRSLTRLQIQGGLVAGIFLAAGYQFQTLGIARTSASKAGLLTGLIVIFVPLLTLVPALSSPQTPAPGRFVALGTLSAFAGLFLLTTPAGTTLSNIFASIGIGDLLVLTCAFAFAGHLLVLARVSTRMPSGTLATLQITFAAAIMLCSLPLEGPHYLVFTGRLILALGITAILGTAAAFTIQSFAQQHLPPTDIAVLLTLEPVFAWITSAVFLHERMGSRALLGAVLILSGIAVTELLGGATQATEIPA